jgi:glycosyltransferase involved in cell wall biosynthesis
MRVLQIVADGSPGGGTEHVLQVLRGLSNIYCLGLLTQENSYLLNQAQSLGIECFGVNFFRSRLDARVPLNLRRVIRKFGPEFVHVHGGRAGFFYALTSTNVSTVYTVHGYHFLHKSPFFIRKFALNAERMASRRAHRVIFVSKHDAEVARAYGLLTHSKRGVVIYNGIPLGQIPKANPREPERLGFIGRLEYPKDPLLFLDVMEHLPRYSATIVGSGALEDKVRIEIERRGLSRVRMLGTLSRSRTLQELSQLHTVIMTSRWEGLPLLPLEAMWAGVPVVATSVGGLSEIIENGESGLLVGSRSADDLARAVTQLTDDPALRERIVENARQRVATLFSEERMLFEITRVYQEIAML